MKSPDAPRDPVLTPPPPFAEALQQRRNVPAQPAATPGSSSREPAYEPRYVSVPRNRTESHGRRNLVLGIVALGVAGVLFICALLLAGSTAVVPVATCLVTATFLNVLGRSRLFRQRNGAFLGWAGVCLLGVVLVLVEQGVNWLSETRQRGLVTATAPATAPAPQPAAAPAAPVAVVAAAPAATPVARPELPSLREAFRMEAFDPDSGPFVRFAKDTVIEADGKKYQVKKGETFPLADVAIGEVHFSIRDRDFVVPSSTVEMNGQPASASTAENDAPATGVAAPPVPKKSPQEEAAAAAAKITEDSQREAIRRYPALGVRDSQANQTYRTAVQELKLSGATDYFRDPDWPLRLAEMIADKEGWKNQPSSSPDSAPAPKTAEDANAAQAERELLSGALKELPGTDEAPAAKDKAAQSAAVEPEPDDKPSVKGLADPLPVK